MCRIILTLIILSSPKAIYVPTTFGVAPFSVDKTFYSTVALLCTVQVLKQRQTCNENGEGFDQNCNVIIKSIPKFSQIFW